jgi:CubicO group peptidase (beta-lactamase class C family)
MSSKEATRLEGVHDIEIDLGMAHEHNMTPPNTQGVVSTRGRHEGKVEEPKVEGGPGTTYTFDVGGFTTAVHAALKDSVVGYVMRLNQHGTTIETLEWNWAKMPVDGGEGWNPDVRQHIASCSKLVTAIAMTKLLNAKNISYDTPIISYLPAYWAKGPNVDKITFRHLMTHTSGLDYNVSSSSSDYPFMKAQIAAGTQNLGKYWYQNMNFGLCRILITTINGNVSPQTNFNLPSIPNANDTIWDYVCIQSYVAYVQASLFTPAGVSGPTLDHPAPDALAYNYPPSGSGWNSGDLSTVIGGAGWHMSVDDLLAIMGTFRRKGTIMSTTQAQTMLDDSFGIDIKVNTNLGALYNKNGGWGSGANQSEQSLAYFLPQDMELVLLVNSPIGAANLFFRDVITNIYLANIKSS